MKALLLTATMLFSVSGSCLAEEGKMFNSSTILTSGEVSGVGGGQQTQFGMFNVCRADKMDGEAVEIATASALGNLGLTLDPPSVDMLSALKIGDEWKTGPANLGSDSIAAYNAKTELKLSKGYRYYVTYHGRILLKGSALILQTMTSLRTGNNSAESQPYSGDFDPKYFHERLQAEILKGLRQDGCS